MSLISFDIFLSWDLLDQVLDLANQGFFIIANPP
jgi:hypothetical protein